MCSWQHNDRSCYHWLPKTDNILVALSSWPGLCTVAVPLGSAGHGLKSRSIKKINPLFTGPGLMPPMAPGYGFDSIFHHGPPPMIPPAEMPWMRQTLPVHLGDQLCMLGMRYLHNSSRGSQNTTLWLDIHIAHNATVYRPNQAYGFQRATRNGSHGSLTADAPSSPWHGVPRHTAPPANVGPPRTHAPPSGPNDAALCTSSNAIPHRGMQWMYDQARENL